MDNPEFPSSCPSCQHRLSVKQLTCGNCETAVIGLYNMPHLLQLSAEDQAFVVQFVLSSGSLKEMAKYMNRSYPLVRNRLNEVIDKLQAMNHA